MTTTNEGRALPDEFPIIPYKRGEVGKGPHPTKIPWAIADLAYSVYSSRFGRSQSLERLAERGGFHAGEMDDYLPDWRERSSALTTAQAEAAALRAEVERREWPLVELFRGAEREAGTYGDDREWPPAKTAAWLIAQLRHHTEAARRERREAEAALTAAQTEAAALREIAKLIPAACSACASFDVDRTMWLLLEAHEKIEAVTCPPAN
jgi:hypothetical protein